MKHARTPYVGNAAAAPKLHTCSCCGGPAQWPDQGSCSRCEGDRFVGLCFQKGYDPACPWTPLQWMERALDELARLRAGGSAP